MAKGKSNRITAAPPAVAAPAKKSRAKAAPKSGGATRSRKQKGSLVDAGIAKASAKKARSSRKKA